MSDIRKWDEVNGVDDSPGHLEAFLESATDSYAILQLRHTDDTLYERFESYSSLQRQGKEPEVDHYEVVYHGSLPQSPVTPEAVMAQLEALYVQFNTAHPEDFTGHSLSVSDIVAFKVGGVVSCHYVDSIGFQELEGFALRENYLKNAEMAVEDDYSSIDGVINYGRKDEPAEGQPAEERHSVLDALKALSGAEPAERKPVSASPRSALDDCHRQSAPHKQAGREER